MKALYNLNLFAICLPFIIALFAFINESALILALLSTMITGFIQMLIALIVLFWIPKNIHLYIYFIFTVLFFVLWLGFGIEYWLFVLPALLAFYLTFILYNQKDKLPQP